MPTTEKRRRRHDDTPDTAGDFRRLAEMPDGPERDELRRTITCAWMPVAERLARRFRNRGESQEDLVQVACLGMVKAVARYDPDHGSAFESFAIPTVVGELKRHFRDHLWSVHVPRRVQELRNRTRSARVELLQELEGRGPTVSELAGHTGLSEDDVKTGMEAHDAYSTVSLDAPMPGLDDFSLGDTLGDSDPTMDLVVNREALKPLLAELPERELHILYLRFFKDLTQTQIANICGISQMHVSRLISRTCENLRTGLLADA
ncbi:SigB/SigF/SigG family RNA polymerase sigma factor [Wenjunlia tyrosinilytica]|uniref:RNA polymerase sigma factor n=1 Tax=Wenjunlia tyrosinilytica TaxID=1544741 RepID=A0A918E162_9ACTN|nr:SigB/SigF/SigG family RNA polymerase sigma factor [Wenjunlia tyrosinilytica]GGO95312.1 RNA polymerase sigma factor [Wenjunlia tyrosinilytica]